jgi:TolB-like protein/DNA-binding winged helix-turn-helix (wHTH) protein/Flp pilus assembly protein TadD
MAPARFAFGPFLLDAESGALFEHGEPVAIGSKALALLRALLEARGRVVTKSNLMDAAWPNTSVEESNLTVQIAALRTQLRLSPDGEEWIATFPRVGYRFAGLFTVEEYETSAIHELQNEITQAAVSAIGPNLRSIEAVGTNIKIHGKSVRAWIFPSFVGAALFLILALGVVGWLHPWKPSIEAASVARMALPLPDKPSIAVLPFANMSGDTRQEFFADGMTDDLITGLSQVSGLFVIARNTSFSYKGKPVKIAQVAEELGVRYVLEGSVQRAGDHVRINAQLIDALSGGHVWADRFDGSLTDVFALQDKVTTSTVDALAVRLTPTQQATIGQKETTVPAAYDQFLRGWEHYRRTTPEDYAKAIPLFEKAIKLDPTYDKAYAALALVYVASSASRWTGSLGISAMEARARAQKYLKVAQRRPNALTHQVVGTLLFQRGVTLESIAEFKQAIALDPSDSWSYALASVALSVANQPDEAVVYINAATRLDPRPPPLFLYYLGFAQFNLEQFDAAAETLERATRLNPNDEYSYLALAAAYGHLGRKQDAVAAVARHNQLAIQHGGVPVTIAAIMHFSYCYCGAMSEVVGNRLSEGLRIAEVPEYLDLGRFVEMNQLTADEIRSLMFGHRLHGRSLDSGEERSASLTMQGTARFAGDWVSASVASTLGIPEFKNNELCIAFGVASYCGAVIRNPGGTKAWENEFIWREYTFSRVD